MTRPKIAALAGAALSLVAVAAIVLITVLAEGLTTPPTDGPMKTPDEHGMVIPGQTGSKFTDGLEVLLLEGSEPATIVSVRSVGGDDTFEFLGALIADPDRSGDVTNYRPNYPPRDPTLGDVVEAVGATIKPRSQTRQRRGYELLLGYEILGDTELGYRSAVEVTYEVAGKTYLWRSPARLLYCPPGRDSGDCMAEAEEADWDE